MAVSRRPRERDPPAFPPTPQTRKSPKNAREIQSVWPFGRTFFSLSNKMQVLWPQDNLIAANYHGNNHPPSPSTFSTPLIQALFKSILFIVGGNLWQAIFKLLRIFKLFHISMIYFLDFIFDLNDKDSKMNLQLIIKIK